MNMKARFFLVAALLLFTSAQGRANLTLPDVLSSGMVLQRDWRVPVWGRADADETVTVRFAGQSKKTIADANGNWRINLDKLHANVVPAMMTVEGGTLKKLRTYVGGEWRPARAGTTDLGTVSVKTATDYLIHLAKNEDGSIGRDAPDATHVIIFLYWRGTPVVWCIAPS